MIEGAVLIRPPAPLIGGRYNSIFAGAGVCGILHVGMWDSAADRPYVLIGRAGNWRTYLAQDLGYAYNESVYVAERMSECSCGGLCYQLYYAVSVDDGPVSYGMTAHTVSTLRRLTIDEQLVVQDMYRLLVCDGHPGYDRIAGPGCPLSGI